MELRMNLIWLFPKRSRDYALGHQLVPEPLRTTEFVPAIPQANEQQLPLLGLWQTLHCHALENGPLLWTGFFPPA